MYAFVEGLHLRQWSLRVVPPLAALATNGAGALDVAWLPRHDAPLRALGLTADAAAAAGPVLLALGGLLAAASSVLRVCAKGVLVRRTTVTTAGAYGLVRHPFYLANVTGALGVWCLAGPSGAALALAWLAVAGPVYAVTVAGEEAGLRRVHGGAWDDYAARVPRLLPWRPGWGGGPGVTWANLVLEGEPPRGLRFLAGAGAVAAVRTGGSAGAWIAAAAGAAWAASLVLARSARRSRRSATTSA